MTVIRLNLLFLALWLIAPSSWGEQATTQLETIEIHAEALNDPNQQASSSENLTKQSSGETLGDYLANQANVNSASYGPGVGRPVVRGMTGYRVKILQNDTQVSDMSAMSQDHAVAVMPKASQRIELLKGPASILYGTSAGGIVRVVDNLQADFFAAGLRGKLATSTSTNQTNSITGEVQLSSDIFSVELAAFRTRSLDYYDGNGNKINDSDVLSEQAQLGLGWQYSDTDLLQLSYTNLVKDYAIPNTTAGETRINLQNKVYGFNWLATDVSTNIDAIKLEAQYTDYLHDETEGTSLDGLFGQKTSQLSLRTDYHWLDWAGTALLSFQNQQLKVCHEHAACDSFKTALRTNNEPGISLENYYNATGFPYSHGHPMPNTQSKTWQLGLNSERQLDWQNYPGVISLGMHLEHRNLVADPSNVQETWLVPASVDADYYQAETDWAAGLSAGLSVDLLTTLLSVNLSYLERLPSADELYWNGVHHATNSYIFGNRNLNKEKSINLDIDWSWQHSFGELTINTFYYAFSDYIFQQNLYDNAGNSVADPFHLSPVWLTKQQAANFYGGAVAYDWKLFESNAAELWFKNQFDVLSAKLANGDNLPRSAPASYLTGLEYEQNNWSLQLHLKHVFEATQLAENEQKTAGYNWLTLYADWDAKWAGRSWKLWLKGDNLLDVYAQNHLSFLKETAPLKGREISLGASLKF